MRSWHATASAVLVAGPRLADDLRRRIAGDAAADTPPVADAPELHASAAQRSHRRP
ncbi:MAG: hypothetical protein U0802_23445 [Candidatus Binatia bacterium]